ncbi:MAG: SurA N-terminal domain-containing protein, partial [Fimbriimonas ginsengisoli]|nr:SurA N-terminal domain-containing protein [Fimbriimonas ginsengisoli]
MSIDKIRRFVEGRGFCGGCMMVLTILLGISFLSTGTCGRGRQQQEPNAGQAPIVRIGSLTITEQSLNKALGTQAGQLPVQEVQMTAQALSGLIDNGILLQLATQKGIKITDDMAIAEAQQQVEQSFAQLRIQLMLGGRLKPTAQGDEFEKVLLAQTGKDLKTLKAEQLEEFKTNLKDPQLHDQVVAQLAGPLVSQAYAAKMQPSDAEVKRQFESWDLKRIFLKADQ